MALSREEQIESEREKEITLSGKLKSFSAKLLLILLLQLQLGINNKSFANTILDRMRISTHTVGKYILYICVCNSTHIMSLGCA